MNIIAFEVEDWERSAFESLQTEHRIEFVAAPLTTRNARDYAEADLRKKNHRSHITFWLHHSNRNSQRQGFSKSFSSR